MDLASSAVLLREPAARVFDRSRDDAIDIRVSSRGLGWSGLDFERRECRPGARHLPHGSRRHLLFVALSEGRVVREAHGQSREYDLTPGYVELVPAGTPVRWNWSTRIWFSALMLEPGFLTRVAHEVFGLASESYQLEVSGRRNDVGVSTIAGVLAREAMSRRPGGRLYAECLANILCVHLLRYYTRQPDGMALPELRTEHEAGIAPAAGGIGYPRPVAEAVRFIEQHYASDLSLSEVAAAVHVSPFHLARLFKRVLGVSPHQYLIQVRVNSARSLLSAGSGRPLAEIATAVGFADQSHLTRHFKRITGVTPRAFRA